MPYKSLVWNKEELIILVRKLCKELKHINKDDKGYYILGGFNSIDLECLENKQILENNLYRFRKAIKYNQNWSQMYKSKKPVFNHIKFFCKLLNGDDKIKNKAVRIQGSRTYICIRYYLPPYLFAEEKSTDMIEDAEHSEIS